MEVQQRNKNGKDGRDMKYEWNITGVIKKIGNCGNADIATFPETLDMLPEECTKRKLEWGQWLWQKGWWCPRGHKAKGTLIYSTTVITQRIKSWKWSKHDSLPRHRKQALWVYNNSSRKRQAPFMLLVTFLLQEIKHFGVPLWLRGKEPD